MRATSGRAGAFFGVFFPYHPELYTNVPLRPGKERRLVYALCEECYARPDKVERVEAHILAAANAELPEQ